MHKQFEKEKSLETSKRLALRRNEPELRIFEQKLRDALVFKEQICQMKEKRHKEIQRQVEFHTIFIMDECFSNIYRFRSKSDANQKS